MLLSSIKSLGQVHQLQGLWRSRRLFLLILNGAIRHCDDITINKLRIREVEEMGDLKLGIQMGYWGAGPNPNTVNMAVTAEKLGYDAIFTAEAWGSDVFTPLAWIGAHTSRIRLGTAVAQLSARTPTATAMAALTLDHLSNGRMILGLGVSGPQVVEGWYGQPFAKPLSRTREYVDIIRQVMAREAPVSNEDGKHYPLPYRGEGSWGLGKSLKPITHPLRSDMPIFLGAEGPKNVTMAAEIADGWLPLYYSPYRQEVYADQIKDAKPGFEICQGVTINICDDVEQGLIPIKNNLALYIGGMGAKDRNFHTELMGRMGLEAEARKIQDLFLAGKKDEAVMAVPTAFADEISLVGPIDRVKDRLQAWRETPVTSLLVNARNEQQIQQMAEIVLG
jgi:F420-dependent oxidoreductase-like protein